MSRLVVIDDSDLIGMAALPFETNPELLVYPDTASIITVNPSVLTASHKC
jgi:hypothetical protein